MFRWDFASASGASATQERSLRNARPRAAAPAREENVQQRAAARAAAQARKRKIQQRAAALARKVKIQQRGRDISKEREDAARGRDISEGWRARRCESRRVGVPNGTLQAPRERQRPKSGP